MDKTQKALKLAIEQMQHLIKIYIPSPEWSGTAIQEDCYETIQACKEALEQPAQMSDNESLEPVVFSESDLDMFQDNAERYNLTTAHPAPHPVQEPVAVITPDNYGEPRLDFIGTFKYKAATAVNPDIPLYTHPALSTAQEPVAKIEVFNLLTKNGAFAIKEEWLWNIRYINSKGIIRKFPNEYPSEKKYAIQSAKYWADFLNCKIVEVDNRGNK